MGGRRLGFIPEIVKSEWGIDLEGESMRSSWAQRDPPGRIALTCEVGRSAVRTTVSTTVVTPWWIVSTVILKGDSDGVSSVLAKTKCGGSFARRSARRLSNGGWKGNKVQAVVGPWTITLDTYTVSTGKSSVTYTRMRAPYFNTEGFRFTIYRKGVFSGLGKMLGMQDIEVGDPEFDEAFIIQGNNEPRVQHLFADKKLRALVQAQPTIKLEVKDSEGWFGPKFPDNVDELHFLVVGVIKDVERLKSLFDLFAAAARAALQDRVGVQAGAGGGVVTLMTECRLARSGVANSS